jgi:hypothetical protein
LRVSPFVDSSNRVLAAPALAAGDTDFRLDPECAGKPGERGFGRGRAIADRVGSQEPVSVPTCRPRLPAAYLPSTSACRPSYLPLLAVTRIADLRL